MTPDEPFVLLRDDVADETRVFARPEALIVARNPDEFFVGLAAMETARKQGKWIAGFMAYEAGYLFEKKLAAYATLGRETPLMAFGIFDGPVGAHLHEVGEGLGRGAGGARRRRCGGGAFAVVGRRGIAAGGACGSPRYRRGRRLRSPLQSGVVCGTVAPSGVGGFASR